MNEEKKNSQPRKSRLEEVQRKLYSKHYRPKHQRATLSKKNYNIDDDWNPDNQDGQEAQDNQSQTLDLKKSYWGPGSENSENAPTQSYSPEKKSSKSFAIILVFAMLFFLGSLGYAYYVFVGGQQAVDTQSIDINVLGPVSVGGGERLSLDVVITNNNIVDLELVDLVIEYPNGTKNPNDLVTDLRVDRIAIGDIEAGTQIRRTVEASLFGEENSTQEIKAYIQYRIAGSNAIFEKEKRFDIVLSESPVKLVVDGLREISSGQEIELTARLSSNSTSVLQDVMLVARYPFGFEYQSAEIKPTIDNNIWVFDKLSPEEEKTLKIRGKVNGQDGEERIFRFTSGIQNTESPDQISVSWGTELHETIIEKSFINLNILVDDSSDEKIVVQSGERTRGIVSFVNNTNETLRDIEIRLDIVGDVLDKRSVDAEDGFYDSATNQIIWNSETGSQFGLLDPRDGYRLSFNFSSLDLSNREFSITDPAIELRAVAQAIRVSKEDVEEKIDTDNFATVQVISDVPVNSYTAFSDGPFSNSGPIPPQAEVPTTYTLVFEIANATNDIQNVKLEGVLPSYVEWNNLYNPTDVSYDDQTRRFVWNAGEVRAGVGYLSTPKTLYVNVTLSPSFSQVGTNPKLLRSATLTGYDTFTETNFVKNLDLPDIRIFNRPIGDEHYSVTE
jgi:hypothetical protein